MGWQRPVIRRGRPRETEMTPIDPARRDAAALALAQASAHLDLLTRIATAHARREAAARRMLTVLEVLRPLVAAVGYLIPDPRR
jgi:hypothetical protein